MSRVWFSTQKCGPRCPDGNEAASTLAVRVQPESQAMPPMPQAPLVPSGQVAPLEPVVQIPYEESLGPKWWNCFSGSVRCRIEEEMLLSRTALTNYSPQSLILFEDSEVTDFLLALHRAKSRKIMDHLCRKRIWKPQVTL